MPTYTTDTTITSNFPDGEAMTLNGDSITVTIDASVFIPTMKYGTITSITTGTLKIVNKTTNMLILEMFDNTKDIRIEANGKFIIDGDLIEIATGDGTAGQTIDFSSIGGNGDSIDFPVSVWVEKEPGGIIEPFINLGDASVDLYPLTLAGDNIGYTGYGGVAGDWDRGRFFEYNRATQTATFGDGTNGHVIPNGCKVFFPNVHLQSTWQDNLGTRSTFDLTNTGSLDWNCVNLNEGWYFNITAFQDLKLRYLQITDSFRCTDAFGIVDIDYFVYRHSSRHTALYNYCYVTTPQGPSVSLKHMYIVWWYNGTTTTSARYLGDWSLIANSTIEDWWVCVLDKRENTQNSNHYLGTVRYIEGQTIKNITYVGTYIYWLINDCIVLNTTFYGSCFVPDPTWSSTYGNKYRSYHVYVNGIRVKFINGIAKGDSFAPYNQLNIPSFNASGIEMYNYHYESNVFANPVTYFVQDGASIYGDKTIIKNCSTNVNHNGSQINVFIDSSDNIFDNYTGAQEESNINRGDTANMIGIRYNNDNVLYAQGIGVFLGKDNVNGSNDEGAVICHFSPPFGDEYLWELTGATSYFDNNQSVRVESGAYCITSTKQPMRGLTSFRSSPYYENQSLEWNEVSIDVEMVNGDNPFQGNWTSLNITGTDFSSELNGVLNSLVGYDSNVGFKMAIKLTNNNASIGVLGYYSFPCYVDPNYQAKDAYITIEGGSDIDQYEMRLSSDTSVLYSWQGVGRFDFALGNLFQQNVYFVRYILTDGTYDRAASSKPFPTTLGFGSNGIVKLYVGDEVQVASSDPSTIWNYSSRTLTEGTYTDEDRAKALTTGKFLALK